MLDTVASDERVVVAPVVEGLLNHDEVLELVLLDVLGLLVLVLEEVEPLVLVLGFVLVVVDDELGFEVVVLLVEVLDLVVVLVELLTLVLGRDVLTVPAKATCVNIDIATAVARITFDTFFIKPPSFIKYFYNLRYNLS